MALTVCIIIILILLVLVLLLVSICRNLMKTCSRLLIENQYQRTSNPDDTDVVVEFDFANNRKPGGDEPFCHPRH